MTASPLPSRGPKRGRISYVTLAFSGVANAKRGDKIKSGSLTPTLLVARKRPELLRNRLTPAFSGAPKRPEWLRNPCIFGNPRQKGRKSDVAASPVPSQGPRRGLNCYVTPAFSRGRNAKRRGKIRSGCLTPMFLEAQKRPVLLRNHCILGGPKRQGRGENQKWVHHPCLLGGTRRGPNCYVTPVVLAGGVQRQVRGEN